MKLKDFVTLVLAEVAMYLKDGSNIESAFMAAGFDVSTEAIDPEFDEFYTHLKFGPWIEGEVVDGKARLILASFDDRKVWRIKDAAGLPEWIQVEGGTGRD